MQIHSFPSTASHRGASCAVDPARIPPSYIRSPDASAAKPATASAADGRFLRSSAQNRVHAAVQAGGHDWDFMQIEFMLKGDPAAAQTRSRFQGNTLLHEACLYWVGHPDQGNLIRVLAKHGVDVNTTNKRMETPLELAVSKLRPGDGGNNSLPARGVQELLRWNAAITPDVKSRGEELAKKGDPWLREAIANRGRVGAWL